MSPKMFNDRTNRLREFFSITPAEKQFLTFERFSLKSLFPILFATIFLAALPLTAMWFRQKVTSGFVLMPTGIAKLLSAITFALAVLLTHAIVGKTIKSSSNIAVRISAVSKAVTIGVITMTGAIAIVGHVLFPNGFAEETMNGAKSELAIALGLSAVLATYAAFVVVSRVHNNSVNDVVADALFSSTLAIATVALGGIVVVLVFLILFFEILLVLLIFSSGLYLSLIILGPIFRFKRGGRTES